MVERTVRNDDQVPCSKPIAHRRNQIVVQLAQMGEGGPVGRASVRRPVIRRESRELELQQREMTPESPGARQVDDVEPVASRREYQASVGWGSRIRPTYCRSQWLRPAARGPSSDAMRSARPRDFACSMD